MANDHDQQVVFIIDQSQSTNLVMMMIISITMIIILMMMMMHMMERRTDLEKMSSSTLEVGLASVSIFQLIFNVLEIMMNICKTNQK